MKAIRGIYTETKAKAISPNGETDHFETKAGMIQGDTLAPYLFIIALDYALRSGVKEELGFKLISRRSKRKGPEIVTDLDFADNIALLSGEIWQAQPLLNRAQAAAVSMELMANTKKIKGMSFNQPDEVLLKTADGTSLEVVRDFMYLGFLVSSSADT